MTEPGAKTAPQSSRRADAQCLLAIGESQSLPPLSTLCQEGQATDCFFVVMAGEFLVAKCIAGERTALSTFGPGSVLALMPALDGEPCAVTISAVNEAEVVVIKREQLLALLDQPGEPNPGLANLLSLLAIRRLRGATSDLAQALLCALQAPEPSGRIDAIRLARIQADSYAWFGS